MSIEAWRLLIGNCVAVVNFILLCYGAASRAKKDFLNIQSVSNVLMIVVYIVSGLWISVFANIAVIVRNSYNTRSAHPRMTVNALILAAACVICVFSEGGFSELSIMSVLPLVSLIFYSIAVFSVKSARGMIIANCIDAALWITYDLRNMLVLCVVTDIFNILLPAVRGGLDMLDKRYVFVKVPHRRDITA